MNLRSPDMDGNESRALMWEKIGVWKSEAPDKIDIKVRLRTCYPARPSDISAFILC